MYEFLTFEDTLIAYRPVSVFIHHGQNAEGKKRTAFFEWQFWNLDSNASFNGAAD